MGNHLNQDKVPGHAAALCSTIFAHGHEEEALAAVWAASWVERLWRPSQTLWEDLPTAGLLLILLFLATPWLAQSWKICSATKMTST